PLRFSPTLMFLCSFHHPFHYSRCTLYSFQCRRSLRHLSDFHGTSPPEVYLLSLHDALPISPLTWHRFRTQTATAPSAAGIHWHQDRKSTRLNSSHVSISYAVFCLKKKGHGLVGAMRGPLLVRRVIFFAVYGLV